MRPYGTEEGTGYGEGEGRTTFVGEQGVQLLRMLFETEAEKYQWLNAALCVVEGMIVETHMRARVYVCVHDLV